MPVPNLGYFVCIDMDSFLVNYVTKAINLVCIQITLCPFEVQLMLPQSFEYESEMFFVLFN